tara:strand:+ start:228 stop:515 length:288 start_codon:yes stop_codon:yes gene_type:complete
MSKIIEAITSINSNAKVVVTETTPNDVDTCTIEWLQGTTEISKTDIKAKITALEYKSNRAKEYPSIADQLDDIYHNGIDAWKSTIKTTKDKYPKS